MAEKKTKAAPKAPAKKATKSAPSSSSPTGVPRIDTNLAAAAAAKALAAGIGTGGAAASSDAPREESASFKNLKAGLNKPTFTGSSSNLLGNLGGSKKSNQPFGGGKQVGKNQTFGADVNRAGVPRRTGGG
jgi:hypothetical protein